MGLKVIDGTPTEISKYLREIRKKDDLCSECKEKATMRVLNYYVRGQDRSLYFCKIHGKEYNLFHPINEQAEEFEPKKEEVGK